MARYAYADPPYPGKAVKHYKRDPSGIAAAEVDHAALIARLDREYPDGWALSSLSSRLQMILALCPPDVRIAAWVKPFAAYKPFVNPGYTWEPVIWRGGRQPRARDEMTVRDHISCNITFKRGTVGAKPDAFAYWLFDLLGMRPGDTLDDLYPGSGAVGRAWQRWQRQLWSA